MAYQLQHLDWIKFGRDIDREAKQGEKFLGMNTCIATKPLYKYVTKLQSHPTLRPALTTDSRYSWRVLACVSSFDSFCIHKIHSLVAYSGTCPLVQRLVIEAVTPENNTARGHHSTGCSSQVHKPFSFGDLVLAKPSVWPHAPRFIFPCKGHWVAVEDLAYT